MKKEAIIGIMLIILGLGFFVVYENLIKPEQEAKILIREGKLAQEREDRESINNSINIFSKVIARYPDTKAARDAYFLIGASYEKLGLNRLAHLKYVYILKSGAKLDSAMTDDIKTRLAHLSILKNQTEEGVDQLLGMLNNSQDKDFRSRIYTELGHTYLRNGEFVKSKRMFDIALSEKGDNEEAIIGKARAYKRLGEDNRAYDLYDYFLKYYGNFSNYASDVRKAYVEQAYVSGYENYRRGSYWSSIEFFRRVIQNFPGDSRVEGAMYWTGECYYSLKQYERAISYFDRVLTNYNYTKDQDARIKKGHSYFMARNFDLAAREFQLYIDTWPNGKYLETARKWKKMSTKEIIYRIKDRDVPKLDDDDDTGTDTVTPDDEEKIPGSGGKKEPEKDKDMSSSESSSPATRNVSSGGGDYLRENVAEL